MRVTRVPRPLIPELLVQFDKIKFLRGGETTMFRIGACCAVMLLVAGNLSIASAQTATAPADAKPTKTKLTMQKLKEMKAKWSAKQAQAEGLPQGGEGEGTGR